MIILNYNIKNTLLFINENFDMEYDKWNKNDKYGSFLLGESSESFLSIGLSKRKVIIDKSKVIKILNKHKSMSNDIIKKIPLILSNPLLIMKSKTVSGRIVVFGEVFDELKTPVMIALELNPYENKYNSEKIYKVASAYGKESLKKYFEVCEDIIYVGNKNRINEWLDETGYKLALNKSNNVKIKDIIESERPRERAIKYGVENLSNEELLAIILKTGTKELNVKELSNKILSKIKNIQDLKNVTSSFLMQIKGIGKVKAITLLSSLELGKRVYYSVVKESIRLNNSSKVYDYFKDLFINEKQEYFYAIYLDSKSKLISYKLLFKGTINTSCVHPREVFKYAFLESAVSIIVIHNHPSGDPTPSIQDKEVTSSLFEIGKIMSLPVVDHIVFGDNKYFSFYEYINNKENNI